MKVSLFTKIFDNKPKSTLNALEALKRIMVGKSKELVSKVREIEDKAKRNELKKQSVNVCFAGKFKTRSISGLISPSGLLVGDVDHCNVDEVKSTLKQLPYVFACWTSISGDGVKFLAKIPIVSGNEEYKAIYEAIQEKNPHLDMDNGAKDISRGCNESFDPEMYINEDATVFEDYSYSEVIFISDVTNIPIEDQNVIANNLVTWFNKNVKGKQGRNNSLSILALAFNDFGVNKETCFDYLNTYQEKDFKLSEIKAIIDSAYRKTSQFRSKSFEDKKVVDQIKLLVVKGKADKEIVNTIEVKGNVQAEIDRQKERLKLDTYWEINDKGKQIFNPLMFKYYLQANGYSKYYPVKGGETFAFVKKEGNFVNEIYPNQIKDFVLEELENVNEIQMYNQMALNGKRFSAEFLNLMATINFQTKKDTREISYLYFTNCILEVTAKGKKQIKYEDISEFVWKKQIIDREYNVTDHHDSEYRTFIWLISGQDVNKYNTMKSVIGYFLNNYKDSVNNRAVILNDAEVNGENPEGGSGKGLFFHALEFLKKVTIINGKSFNPNGSFIYQTVSVDTQILVFDDVQKNFKFENLFSVVTEGITLEYKGQQALKLPVEDSPKIGINTNYGIKGVGGSFTRRKFEVALSNYFNANNTPVDHFGHSLFFDWDSVEWQKFDSFMINCLQYYLKNGLVKGSFENLEEMALMNSINPVVYAYWKEGQLVEGVEYTISAIQDSMKEIINEYQTIPTPATIHKSITTIESFLKLENHKKNVSNGKRWFSLGNSIIKNNDGMPF